MRSLLVRRNRASEAADAEARFVSALAGEDYLACDYFGEPEVLSAMSRPLRSRTRTLIGGEALSRAPPVSVIGDAPDTVTYLPQWFDVLDRTYASALPVGLCELDEAVIGDQVVSVVENGAPKALYETLRRVDRAAGLRAPSPEQARQARRLALPRGRTPIFVGSAGSGNYGHWLVDDLPRVVLALEALPDPLSFLLRSCGRRLDRVRVETIRWLAAGRDVDVHFLPADGLVRVPRLRFVTPVSFHPTIKSRPALQRVRTRAAEHFAASGGPRRRIVLLRGAGHGRQMLNEADVLGRLAARGFTPVDVTVCSAMEQARIVGSADSVVGVMGAAMCNVVYAPPGLPVLHICPSGWNEPFYWDLADRLGQPYRTLLCGPDRGAEAYNSDFAVDLGRLDAAVDELLAQP